MPATDTPPQAALDLALRRSRWSVLGLLACCVALIALRGFTNESPPLDRGITTLAVLLGLGAILLRRMAASPGAAPRRAVALWVASLVFCGGLGLLGVFVAYAGAASGTGILFSLAGVIFALRPGLPVGSGH